MDIIREDFFHFLWQNLHFSQNGLRTTCGEPVYVLHPGYRNEGDGADYRFSRILMGGIRFCGDVELHKMASEWYRHGHHRDSRYERVILHVVVRDDLYKRKVLASDGHQIPTVELRSSLPASLSRLWRAWHRPVELPCSGLVSELPEPGFRAIMNQWDRSYFRHRLKKMLELYPDAVPMSAAWKHMVVRGFFQGLGYHKNQEPMLRMADHFLEWYASPEMDSLAEAHQSDGSGIRQMAQRLLAEAGLAAGSTGTMQRLQWDFSASRPANRPGTRLPQAVELSIRLLHHPVTAWLNEPADALWKEICRLEEYSVPGEQRRKTLFHNILVPSLYLLGRWLHDRHLVRQAVRHWKRQRVTLPENVKKTFENGGFPHGEHTNRLAILHQFKYYCREKRCCDCRIMKYFVRA